MSRRAPTDLCARAAQLRARGDELAARAAAAEEAVFTRSKGKGARGARPDPAGSMRRSGGAWETETDRIEAMKRRAGGFYVRALEAWELGKCQRAPSIRRTVSPPPPRGWKRARGMNGAVVKRRRRGRR